MLLKDIHNVKKAIILSMWDQSFLEFVRAAFCVSLKDTCTMTCTQWPRMRVVVLAQGLNGGHGGRYRLASSTTLDNAPSRHV